MKFSKLQDWLDWQTELHPQSIDMGLERIRPVFTSLLASSQTSGLPTGKEKEKGKEKGKEKKLATKVIVVAGTNGKGSIVSLLESLYVSGGYQVGTYTSPHLLRYNERVRINGEPVSDEQLCNAFDHVENVRGETSLTYFEFGTLAAFDVFQHQKLELVILEVGLGGRLDAVNLVDADVAIISNIQLDHTDWLGDTREKIAIEKLGVARPGKPLIIADDDLPDNVLPLLSENFSPEKKLVEKKMTTFVLGESFGFSASGFDHRKDSWDWWCDAVDGKRQKKHSLPLPALRGAHQFKNASAALTATALLNAELPLSMNHIRVGLNNVSLPGRFQFERVADKTVILDVAHNPHGMQAFIQNLKQLPALGETYLVFAMLNDKSVEEVVLMLDAEIDHWLLAGLDNERALPLQVLADVVSTNATNRSSLIQFECVADACQLAFKKMQPNDYLLVVGSFFTVADALLSFNQRLQNSHFISQTDGHG